MGVLRFASIVSFYNLIYRAMLAVDYLPCAREAETAMRCFFIFADWTLARYFGPASLFRCESGESFW